MKQERNEARKQRNEMDNYIYLIEQSIKAWLILIEEEGEPTSETLPQFLKKIRLIEDFL